MLDDLALMRRAADLDPDWKRDCLKEWDELTDNERDMFHKVAALWSAREVLDPDDLQYWVSREEIATASEKARLNDAEIKRLENLAWSFLHAKKRVNGHFEEGGRFRPHNSSWVYRPIFDAQLTLAERSKKHLDAARASAAKKPVEVEKPWQPARFPTMYEQYGMGKPDSDQEAAKPESALERVIETLGQFGDAFLYLLTLRFLRNGR